MKKIKFLNGINAMFALAVVALATTFTSCEKEEFNVNVDPINAQATISPIVLYVADGVTTDVTSTATINSPSATFTGNPPSATFTGNPALAATTATVTVSHNGISTEVKVNVPALQAGQFATLTPTIILQKESPETSIFPLVVGTVVQPSDKAAELKNTTDHWYSTTVKYKEKSGNKVLDKNIVTTDENDKKTVEAILNALGETYQEPEKEVENVPVYAHSLTKVSVTYTVAITEYKIIKKTETGETVLATAKVESYTTSTAKVETGLQIPGHSHAPAGHGNGHGADPNAGGGVVIAD